MEDPDWENDVSAEDGRMCEVALSQMKQALEGTLWQELQPFLDSDDMLQQTNGTTPANTNRFVSSSFFPVQKEPPQMFGDFV